MRLLGMINQLKLILIKNSKKHQIYKKKMINEKRQQTEIFQSKAVCEGGAGQSLDLNNVAAALAVRIYYIIVTLT